MVGHIPLKDVILVRIQVPQPFDSLRSLMAKKAWNFHAFCSAFTI